MAITFVPSAGDVLMCDFNGFKPPEMIKVRPVLILSPRSRRAVPDTYIVVSTSTTPPAPVEGWHYQLKRGSYACFDQNVAIWAKCNMVTCVAAHRLDRMKSRVVITGFKFAGMIWRGSGKRFCMRSEWRPGRKPKSL